MSDELERIGADCVGIGWVGTYKAPDDRIAVVTVVTETEELALAAARSWVVAGREEPPARCAYVWRESDRYADRFEVFLARPLRMDRVPLASP